MESPADKREERFRAYLDDELEAAEREEFERQLQEDAELEAAFEIYRSMVEAPKVVHCPVFGSCHWRLASSLIAAPSSPSGGGLASRRPMIEKRSSAQRLGPPFDSLAPTTDTSDTDPS